ncbi:hypothetical protein OG592_40405 [Streptomyces avidinii]|uniref:hypothetical protein n=1 Tax=Streptomyces avidinii TaxID=1895 RepID=UPI00386F4AF4|nr:hypothetical protein OG592_00400 [Streptomyces avidinii]WST49991.1 hypothetical protein OG592_40405 [Streptomyces avidinii]
MGRRHAVAGAGLLRRARRPHRLLGLSRFGRLPLCPHCAAPAAAAPWPEALGAWYRTGAAPLRCPGCGRSEALPEWAWEDDRFALAHLGFEAWNAARLRPEFVAGFGRVLGHRVRTVAGKL